MLERLHPRQRPPSRAHIARLANDMAHGRFVLSPDPIVITKTGLIANGRHRLTAIVQSGTTQAVMVSSGWDDSVYDTMDAGLRRKLSHRVNVDWLRSHHATALVRATVSASKPGLHNALTEHALVAVALEYAPHFEAVLQYPNVVKMRSQALAAVVRARLNGHSDGRLAQFVHVATTGLSGGPQDSAAVTLFSYLMQTKNSGRHMEFYQKTQAALSAFLAERELAKLYAREQDLFPIPAAMLVTAGLVDGVE